MDETTVKVLAIIQARLQIQMGALAIALQHPNPNESLGAQWGKLARSVSLPALLQHVQTGTNQVRLMAEAVECEDGDRILEINRELQVLDQLIQEGLAGLWTVPPRTEN